MQKKSKLLIVDENLQNLKTFEESLLKEKMEVIKATNGKDAFRLSQQHNFALAIIAVQMSGMEGVELAELIQEQSKNSYLPVLFTTTDALEDDLIRQCFQVGGVDILSVPFHPILLKEKIQFQIKQTKQKQKNKKVRNELEGMINDLQQQNEGYTKELKRQKENGEKLHDTYDIFTTVLESLDENISVADLDNHEILFANQNLKETLGEDPTGKACWRASDDQTEKEIPSLSCKKEELLTVKGEPNGTKTTEHYHEPTGKWYAIKDRAIRWINGKYVRLEIARDITKQKHEQQLLIQAKERGDRANKLKNQFLSLVAHDIRSPFTTILATIRRILKEEHSIAPIHRKLLKNCLDSGMHLVDMTTELLKIGQLNTGSITPDLQQVDAHWLIEKFISLISQPAQQKDIRIINSVPLNTRIYVDTYLFGEVINNLLSNAIKFCHYGGTVQLYLPPDDKMVIAVRDNGVGIPEKFVPHILTQGIKTTTVGTAGEVGTGLGLPYCRDIMEAHSGTIRFESKSGEGTVFYLEIPDHPSNKSSVLNPQTASYQATCPTA